MALRELSSPLRRLTTSKSQLSISSRTWSCRRYASTITASNAESDLEELESRSSFNSQFPADDEKIQKYNPTANAKGRNRELPPSRYQFRSPRYYRGPLHPHQPPPRSDPASREYFPGPFSKTRLEQTYQSTIAPDLMALGYVHKPPGTVAQPKADRLRSWDDSSPYYKNRPKRGPRGPGDVLRLIEQDITWQNIPKIQEVTIHSFVSQAMDDAAYLHVAGMMIRAITGIQPTVHKAKRSVSQFGLRKGEPVALTATMYGDMAYEFVDKCINLVFPKMKDWPGIKGTTGDSSGNLAWGFDREGAILFPEVECNYDMYPPKMIPGFHVLVKTTATSDRHARLLLSAMGIPFYGKLVD